jgi:isoquinoline 1-oxidoreductase subunit beta
MASATIVNLSRRDFMKKSSAAGAALILGIYLPDVSAAARIDGAADGSFAPNAFLSVAADGVVTIWVARSEMGQGVRTALPMIVAEELGADWSKTRISQADLDAKYGDQVTGGSLSVRSSWEPLRKAGATAREMLLQAAAKKWNVAQADCRAVNGTVIHPASGRRVGFGELVAAASVLPVPAEAPLKDPKDFRIVGRPLARTDVPVKVDGIAAFGIDVKIPGMLYAVIARPPAFGGSVESFDAAQAKAIPGVRQVVEIPRTEILKPFENRPGGAGHQNFFPGGIAVIAQSTWAAMAGKEALQVKWNPGLHAAESTASLREQFQKLAQTAGSVIRNDGDFQAAYSQAAKKLDAAYEVPFLAHADMEPQNCTAHVTPNGCEIWAPSQNPLNAATSIAHALGIPQESVKIHITLLGGGFGRRLNQDYALEAALVSKAAAAPVQVVWTREDDMQHDYYRPASYHAMQAALDAQGQLIAWRQHAISPSIEVFYDGPGIPVQQASEVDSPDFPAFVIPNFRLEFTPVETAVPRGWWRSVEESSNVFAVQSFLDEVAAAAGKDPLEFRLQVLGKPRRVGEGDGATDIGRLRGVIELAAMKAGWSKPLPKGQGRGIAASFGFASYVAHVAEVAVALGGKLRVQRVVAAVDCGTVINPNIVAAQIESAIVFGLSAALMGEITIEGGAVKQTNFNGYPVLRMREMPEIEVHIVPSQEAPGGIGEPGVPPIAPAVANAIFAATGKRVRRLPIRAEDLRSA